MTTKAWERATGPSLWRSLFSRRGGFDVGALLWDMDGLLVDSEPVWTIAERDLFARWGLEFTPAMKAAVVGGRLDTSVPKLIALGGPGAAHESTEQVSQWLLHRMTELFAADLPLMPGAGELLAAGAAAGLPQVLVSSSYRVLVDAVLGGLPANPFVASIAGDEVVAAKPDPEGYLAAAFHVGVEPARCVVLEDTPTGARAGANAGARVVYCPSVAGAGAPGRGWWAVTSLRDVSIASLRAWPT